MGRSPGTTYEDSKALGTSASRDSLCQEALIAGLMQARRQGVVGEAAEDCALGFVAHLLLQVDRSGIPAVDTVDTPAAIRPWLLRCAANWTRNSRRGERRRQHRERFLSEMPHSATAAASSNADSSQIEVPAIASDPAFPLLQQELRERLTCAMMQLPLLQYNLLRSYYLEGDSIVELAVASGRTPNAVRQALWALRKRLRALLAAQGMTESEARDYLCVLREEPGQSEQTAG